MARFPSIDTQGNFEAPQVRNGIQTLVQPMVDDAAWEQAWIRSGDDLDNYLDQSSAGMHPVVSSQVGNLPTNTWGALEVIPQGNAVTQRYTSWLSAGQVRTYVRTFRGEDPTPWIEVGGSRISTSTISSGHLDDYRTPATAGFYRVTNADAVEGLPAYAVGVLAAIPMTTSNVQFYTAWFGANDPQVYVRTFSGSTPGDWVELTGQETVVPNYNTVNEDRGVISQTQALATFNARLLQHADAPVPLVFAGSSTTGGHGATTHANRWVNRLTAHLQRKYPNGIDESTVQASNTGDFTPVTIPGVHGYNIGRGGTQADTYLTDDDTPLIAALEPALIIHMVGSNDYARRRPITTYKADLEHRIAHLSAAIQVPHAHVLVHQFQRKDISTPDPLWSEYAEALQQIADEQPDLVAYVNLSDAFNTTGLDRDDPFGFLGPDDVHTNNHGHRFLAHLLSIGLGEQSGNASSSGGLLQGDTGPRDVSHLLTNATSTSPLRVQRVGNMVTLDLHRIQPTEELSSGSSFIGSLPVGFRPNVRRDFALQTGVSSSVWGCVPGSLAAPAQRAQQSGVPETLRPMAW